MSVDKNFLTSNMALLKYGKYEEFFNKLSPSDRSDYAEWMYFTAGINFVKYLNNIPSYLFYGSKQLKSIKLSVDSIGEKAFANSGLIEVKITEGCNLIDKAAFTGCNDLLQVTILDGPNKIQKDTFSQCPNLMKVYVPKSVTIFSPGVFSGDDKVQIITPLADRNRTNRLIIPKNEIQFYREHMRIPKGAINTQPENDSEINGIESQGDENEYNE